VKASDSLDFAGEAPENSGYINDRELFANRKKCKVILSNNKIFQSINVYPLTVIPFLPFPPIFNSCIAQFALFTQIFPWLYLLVSENSVQEAAEVHAKIHLQRREETDQKVQS
jgi:hypothetical protein